MSEQTPETAQASLDRFCAGAAEERERRAGDGTRVTVGVLADAEPLLALPPAPYPAVIEVTRSVADNATVAYRGNRYATPPGLARTTVVVRQRLGAPTIEVVAASGGVLVTHRAAPDGAGTLVRSAELHSALEKAVLSAFTTTPPCDRKENRPPGNAALAAAAKLLGPQGCDVQVDLAVYEQIAGGVR